MPPISFFILGLVVASVTAAETTTESGLSSVSEDDYMFNINNDSFTTETPSSTNFTASITSTTNMTSVLSTITTMNMTRTTSTITPSTKRKGDGSSPAATPTVLLTTPKAHTESVTSENKHKSTTVKPMAVASDSTGIIILIVIILVALGFGVACFVARKRGRRYSVDFTSRPDDANIPLSTVEPELPVDSAPQNGLKTFESTETTSKEPEEPEAKPEAQEEQKAEADKSVVDPSAPSPDSAPPPAPAPSPDSTEDKPKVDVGEQSPPAPVEPSVEEKTDDEGVVSNKTSVESLKEANENNSNNADFSQKMDLKLGNIFWEVPLDSPV